MQVTTFNMKLIDAIHWLDEIQQELKTDDQEMVKFRCLIFEKALTNLTGDRPIMIINDTDCKNEYYARILKILERFILHVDTINTYFPRISELFNGVSELMSK